MKLKHWVKTSALAVLLSTISPAFAYPGKHCVWNNQP